MGGGRGSNTNMTHIKEESKANYLQDHSRYKPLFCSVEETLGSSPKATENWELAGRGTIENK